MISDPIVLLAAGSSGLAVALVVRSLIPPPRPLRARLHPYVAPTVAVVRPAAVGGPFLRVFGPIARQGADAVGRLLDRGNESRTAHAIRQAGWYRGLGESEAVAAYRMIQLRAVLMGILIPLALGQVLHLEASSRVAMVALGLVIGGTRLKGRLAKAAELRREIMRIEIYTINQLLAMRVRAGGGVVSAVQATVDRGQGEVVSELAEVLRLHRAGWSAGDAFRRVAELTPEPFCGRTYRLLAAAEERGADLGKALLELAEDVRETRRESIKRSATKRRAAMLVPTIAILAPVLILFVAAPLPYLITGWR